MQFKFAHNNINVADLEKSLAFYEEALGLKEVRRINRDGYDLSFLEDGVSGWQMELTCLHDHPQAYDLGENEIHTCLRVDDFDAAFKKHTEMGCVCFENAAIGVYFIEDPDGYWVEITPTRK
jgi:lactoylglutathione lyase